MAAPGDPKYHIRNVRLEQVRQIDSLVLRLGMGEFYLLHVGRSLKAGLLENPNPSAGRPPAPMVNVMFPSVS